MKHDTIIEAVKDAPVVAGTFATFSLYDSSLVVAIIVGILTAIYTVIRIAHSLRKWHLEEKILSADKGE